VPEPDPTFADQSDPRLTPWREGICQRAAADLTYPIARTWEPGETDLSTFLDNPCQPSESCRL